MDGSFALFMFCCVIVEVGREEGVRRILLHVVI